MFSEIVADAVSTHSALLSNPPLTTTLGAPLLSTTLSISIYDVISPPLGYRAKDRVFTPTLPIKLGILIDTADKSEGRVCG